MTMRCEDARSLVGGYLDGELSEEQASPLRQHLLACPGCRETAKAEKGLKRWFEGTASARALPPEGFAARVASAAFAGLRPTDELAPAGGAPAFVGRPVPIEAAPIEETPAAEAPALRLVLSLTAAAAAVLLVLTLAIQLQGQPRGSRLEAQGVTPPLSEVLRELDELNAREAAEEPEEAEPEGDR
jgi:anti-sigma factor RsiW